MFDISKTYTLPFENTIPSLLPDFLLKNSFISCLLKLKRRQVFLSFKRQKSLQIDRILACHKNILWINISAPSLGDSLMDLSSRVMLNNRKVDLFTDIKNADLYRSDKIFGNIFTCNNEIDSSLYDLIIIDSYSSRSIKIKAEIAPLIPYVGMYGFFNGPEVNRVLFSFSRLNFLLGNHDDSNKINATAKASISISNSDQLLIEKQNLPERFVAIAIGGEWKHRTYNKWDKVIKELFLKYENINVVIVGSGNGLQNAEELSVIFKHQNLFNCVSKFSFNQTAQIISLAEIFLCVDGGLMHAANAVDTPIVALLARLSAQMQLTKSINAFTIFDKDDVNNINEKNILTKFEEASSFVDNHLQVE